MLAFLLMTLVPAALLFAVVPIVTISLIRESHGRRGGPRPPSQRLLA